MNRAVLFAICVAIAPGCSGCFSLDNLIPDAGGILDLQGGIDNLDALYDGGVATMGSITATVTFNDDGTMSSQYALSGSSPFLGYLYADPDHVYGTGDFNNDGVSDYLYENVDDGGTSTEIEQRDTDMDGTVDTFDIRTVDYRQRPYKETDTRYLVLDAGYQLLWNVDTDGTANFSTTTCDGKELPGDLDCNGFTGFPSDFDAYNPGSIGHAWPPPNQSGVTFRQVLKTSIVILEGNGPGLCDSAHAKILERAIISGLGQAQDCLPTINPEMGKQLMDGVARPLLISCSNSCGCYLATADLPTAKRLSETKYGLRAVKGYVQRLSFNTALIDADQKGGWPNITADLTEIMVHELMHTGGVPHTPPGSEGCPGGQDPVYGASRYCTGCPTLPMTPGGGPAPEDAARDCAMAAIPDLSTFCGIDIDILPVPYPVDPTGKTVSCGCSTSNWIHEHSCEERWDYGTATLTFFGPESCSIYHKYKRPVFSGGEQAQQCCRVGDGSSNSCMNNSGCKPGWGHWSQLGGGDNTVKRDCFKYPVGACESGRPP